MISYRYRNFRTLTTPQPVQFASVALDLSNELVAAGGQDVFEIYLWSMKLGRLLEVISGHEGPVVTLEFSPVATSSTMVSGSWDKTIRIWNCLENSSDHETIDALSDVMCVAFKPNGEEIAVATLNGSISFFNVKSSQQIGTIEGRTDLGSGRSEVDLITAKKNLEGKYVIEDILFFRISNNNFISDVLHQSSIQLMVNVFLLRENQ